MDADVLILGGGAAGLAAAHELHGSGLHALVLEARDRLGGRIYTLHPKVSPPVELGAEFVHGRPPEILSLARQAAVSLDEVPAVGGGPLHAADRLFEKMRRHRGPDLSFSEFLAQAGASPADAAWAKSYVEGFNAADSDLVSVEWLNAMERYAAGIDGDRIYRPHGGYDALVYALRPASVRLNWAVQAVRWQRGKVVAETERGNVAANRALVTLPLGVLQSGLVRFEPEIPEKREAIARLASGQAVRITLRFDRPLWPADTSFLFSERESFPVWWARYDDPAMITGWTAGPKATPLVALGESIVLDRALGSLADQLGREKEELEERVATWHTWDWSSDRFSMGGYSYVPVGAMDAPAALARPVEGTLFFAGEATASEGRNGTVHGAIASGIRAARQMLSAEAGS